MATQAISKITVRDCGANAAAVLAMDGEDARAPLIRVYGVARDIMRKKGKDRQTGEDIFHEAIVGDFRAANMVKGDRYSSGILYLPAGIHELLVAPIKAAKADNASAEVEFGFDIYGRKSSSPAGYGYVAVVLGEDPSVADPMKRLEERLAQTPGVPALPGPAVGAAPAIEDKSAKAK